MTRRSLLLAVFAGLLVVSTMTGLVLAVLYARGDNGFGLGERVAVLEVEGVIMDDAEMLENIERFRDDPSVRAFVIDINSPGGVVAPSQSIYRALREIREDGVPVIASIGGVGASGGYYIALAADSIYVLPGSITGSIGVVMEFPNASELMDRVGLEMEIVKSSAHKDIGSPFRDMNEADRALLTAVVQDVYDQFVDVVAAERDLPREQVLAIADGRLLSGRQAISHGLADREGNVVDAIHAAGRLAGLGDDPRVVRPPEPGVTLIDVFFGRAEAGLRRLWSGSHALRGPVLKFVPAL